jgi:mannose-6-phosphate isomerase-like protein (cupin superfamily)
MSTVSLSNAVHYLWGDNCDGWHFLKTPNLSVIRERVPPGKSEKRHYHSVAQQFFYILSGQAVMELDGQEFQLAAGQGLHIPPEKPHQFRNPFAEPVEFMVISNPTTRGDRVDLDA